MKRRGEEGISLVETVLAIVIAGIVVGGLFAALGTAAYGSKSSQDFTTADRILRNYAEAAKESARTGCNAGSTFTVAYTVPSDAVAAGFSVVAQGTLPCPSISSTSTLLLEVHGPGALRKQLNVTVRKS